MANVKLPYRVRNNLDSLIIKEVGKRMAVSGIKIRKKDIINEVANHCEVTYDNIMRISRNVSQPSLAVALMIADYFNVNVDDIFKIK